MSKRIVILAIVLVIYFLYRLRDMKYCQKQASFVRGLVPGAYMIVFSLGTILLNLNSAEGLQPPGIILRTILYFIMVAITEEIIFRGIVSDTILRFMLKKKENRPDESEDKKDSPSPYGTLILSVILSGLFFGAAHAMNFNYSDPRGVLIQMLGAFLMGMFLTGVYYRTGNLMTVIFLHAVNDLAAVFPYMILRGNDTITNAISSYDAIDILLLVPYLVATIIILRKSKVKDIC